jgi:outer membrane immunogenic protein
MKKILLAGIAVAAFCGVPAFAADMPVKAPYKAPPPVYSWTGWYIGGNVGYGWGTTTGDLEDFTALFAAAVAAGGTPRSLSTKSSGVIGGLQAGYNWQNGMFVWGAETDIQASGIDDHSTINFPGGGVAPSTSTGEERLGWLGTARLRAGYVVAERTLLYATGGLAYGGVSNRVTNIYNPTTGGNFSGSASQTKTGWTAGGGVDWAWTDRLSLRVEYLYVDLGSTTVRILDPVNFPGTFADYRFQHKENIVRVGLNYKFGG